MTQVRLSTKMKHERERQGLYILIGENEQIMFHTKDTTLKGNGNIFFIVPNERVHETI